MKFGPIPLAAAEGAVLAHSVALPKGRLRKGRVLEAADIQAMAAMGMRDVIVAQLDADDLAEDAAAAALAQAIAGAAEGIELTRPTTGRVNLLAKGPGVVALDVSALEAVNAVDPMITIATVPPWQQMTPRGMIATIKIISYAVPGAALEKAVSCAGEGAIALRAPVLRSATLIITEIPAGVGDKGRQAIADRLAALNVTLSEVIMVPHEESAMRGAIEGVQDPLVLILTGSATSDIHDVAPSAVRAAGGRVDRFGMPVDPGNLLFIGVRGAQQIIGLPGCARSPALNGADWVLSRVICGVPVTSEDIAGMGVGGLLKEIPTRPQPRRGKAT